jgi:hypothetical protein
MGTRIPFGTFIAVAALAAAFASEPVRGVYERAVQAYLSWAGLT